MTEVDPVKRWLRQIVRELAAKVAEQTREIQWLREELERYRFAWDRATWQSGAGR
jgi:hypothetical protein